MKRAAFTFIEVLVVICLIAVLMIIGGAVTSTARTKAESAECMSNLRQWVMAMQHYTQDNDGYLPRRGQGVQPVFRIDRDEDWFNALPPYLEMTSYREQYEAGNSPKPADRSVFVCPSAKVTNSYTHFITYGMNMYLSRWDQPDRMKLNRLPDLSKLAFMADAPGGYASTVPSNRAFSVIARHGGHANVSFLDGHIESFRGDFLGCGTGEKEQPNVRWKTGIPGDIWRP